MAFSCKKTLDKSGINYIYKIRGLNDINISPVNKEKTYTSDNNPDVTVFMCMKPLNKIEQPQEKNNSKLETIQEVTENYKPCIMRVIGEIKHTLSKFKEKMHRFELSYLKKEIMNQYDAEDITFLIGCIISKLKEELNNQEQLLSLSSSQESIQPTSKKLHFYKHGKHHNYDYKNKSQSKFKVSQGKDNTTVSHENSSISLEANHKIASWNNRNLASTLNEVIDVKENNLNTTSANWKHSSPIGSVSAIEHIVPDQCSTRTKQKEVQYVHSDDDHCSTCSTVPLFPMKNKNVLKGCKHENRIIYKNKNKLSNRLKSSIPYSPLLHIRNVSKPQLTKSTFNGQNTSYYRRSKTDLDIVSVHSNISSRFSAYIVPTTSHNMKNVNSSKISNVGTVDEKMSMICKVVLDKL